jgi:hypothetical protein
MRGQKKSMRIQEFGSECASSSLIIDIEVKELGAHNQKLGQFQ